MKKIVLACMAVLLTAPAAWALDSLNPTAMVSKGQVAVGFAGTYVFEQKFKDYDLNRKYSDGYTDTGKKSAKFTDDQYYLTTVTFGVLDWLNVYGRVGAVRGGKWKDHDRDTGQDWQANLDDCFAWAAGFKARLWQMENGPAFGLGVEYLSYNDRTVKDWANTTQGYSASDDWTTKDKMDYWQVDVTALGWWTLGRFTPYVGLGWTYGEISYTGRWSVNGAPEGYIDYDSDMKLKDNITALAGVSASITEGLSVTLAGTLVSSSSLSLGIAYAF